MPNCKTIALLEAPLSWMKTSAAPYLIRFPELHSIMQDRGLSYVDYANQGCSERNTDLYFSMAVNIEQTVFVIHVTFSGP